MSLFGGKKREDGVGGTSIVTEVTNAPVASPAPTPPVASTPAVEAEKRFQPSAPARAVGGEAMANIGKSIVIKGDLTGEEDLMVEGKVEGRIHLPNHKVTIGQGGSVEAEVHAKQIVVIGRIAGNVSAGERLEIQASGVVNGDIRAPRLVVQEGAALNGSIEMSVKEAPAQSRPAHAPSSTGSSAPSPAVSIAAAGAERRTG